MKKTIVMALAILFACSLVFAAAGESDNYQKIYSVSDPVYGYVRDLYLLEGYALPSTTGPWSGSELRLMLSIFENKTLEGAAANLYETGKKDGKCHDDGFLHFQILSRCL